MPAEFSRTTKRKRVNVGSSYVDVPVITEISFIDPSDRYQETQFTIDLSVEADREVHVDRVYHTNEDQTQDTSRYIDVERIDKWSAMDASDRHQETQVSLDNKTGADSIPPSFTSHFKTHVVRYKNPDTPDTVWIDSELIDEFVVVDPSDRYQETHFTLSNPQNDDDAQANPDDPDITDTGNGIDPAWRTDPFQNIVNISGFTPHRLKVHYKTYYVVCYSGPWPPYGYNGSYKGGTLTADDDAGMALTQAEAIIISNLAIDFPAATVEDQSGILTGPQSSGSRCFSFSITYWLWEGDGYYHGTTDIPEDQYVTDPDAYLYRTDGDVEWSGTDPGPPAL